MILLLDNFDSFTYNIVDYLRRLGLRVEVVRNDVPLSEIQMLDFKALVLSPGPGVPQKAGVMPEVLIEFAEKKPILGICLGHQAVGCHFGAELTKAIRPMHGKISPITHSGEGIFSNLPPEFEVVRYHSLVLQNLPASLEAKALSDEGEIMALAHKTLPIWGLQFHPEAALTQFGLRMLENWLETTYPLV